MSPSDITTSAKPAGKNAATAKARKTPEPVISPVPVEVTARIPSRHLRAFETYARHYSVPLEHLLPSETWNQAACLDSDVLAFLAWMESARETTDIEEVTLRFCPDTFALLSRVAELLRRPLAQLAGDLLAASGAAISECIEDCTAGKQDWEDSDMIWNADSALKFARLAAWNRTPGIESAADKPDGWKSLNLRRPEELETLLKLKGGAA